MLLLFYLFIKDIKINIPIDKKIFSEVTVTLDAENSSKDSSIWNTFRIAPLTKKEERTYFYVDSVFEKNKLELKIKAILSLMDGGFPVKFLNIPFEHLMQFNLYEKYRFGFGFETNKKLQNGFRWELMPLMEQKTKP